MELPHLSDAAALRRWLTDAGVEVAAVPGLPSWNGSSGVGEGPRHRRLPADFDGRVEDVLGRAFQQAVRTPFGAAVLCCYVWHLCLEAWKCSYHFDRMWATLRGAQRCWAAQRCGVTDDAHLRAADATALLLDVLDWEIAIENEMDGNDLERLERVAARAAASAARAVEAARAVRHPGDAIAEFVGREAAGSQRCDAVLSRTGAALSAFFAGHADARGSLAAALGGLREAERAAGCDRDQRSELRAYRKSVERLVAVGDNPAWLHIDEGSVVHLYPFAVRGMSPGQVVAAARTGGTGWRLDGVRPRAVRESMELDDVWNGSDALGRRYDGTVVTLPDVVLADLDGRTRGRLAAEVRLSELGNHHLRLTMQLHDRTAHDLYTAMLLSRPEQSEGQVRCGGGSRIWPRLSALAVDIAEAVGHQLGAPAAVSVRPGMFHVMITVLQASTGPLPRTPEAERQPVESVAQLGGVTGGQLLLQAVPHIVGAPAEWIHHEFHGEAVLAVGGRPDEALARTCNTTLVAALGSPAYWITNRLQAGEFVASLDGLFAGWFDQLAIFLATVNRYADEKLDEQDLTELVRQVEQLGRERTGLHRFAADARATLDLIRSPALVASPLVALELRAMLAASGFEQREAELARNIESVLDDRLGQRLETLVRRRREREAELVREHERRQRVRLDTMLAIIAAVGVSGLGQILQAGYDLRATAALATVLLIVLIMLVVGAAVWYASRSGQRVRRTHRSARRARGGRGQWAGRSARLG
ncbi:hypothetical protein [Plantactinospora sp. KBS50]|uniref:hypothetical protein n=1 Tax=Plantactinospora sp. KBS50 TaxID=2024580 RepID=UPI0012FD416F|nr:hypothetical protein [Plantactinospora sp. KBS50]